jgi:uncharacterized repeat protein (TIGR03803 family)
VFSKSCNCSRKLQDKIPGIRPNGGNIVKLRRIIPSVLLISTLFLTVYAAAGDKDTPVHNFDQNTGGTNTSGYFPHGQLLMDASGNLYGANLSGGVGNAGTIFELTPNGSGGWNYNVLVDCNIVCFNPLGSLVMDGAGNIYGSSVGRVFELSPSESGGWNATVAYTFSGGTNGYDGYAPMPSLVLDSAGNVYGANYDGGINNQGYVFELSPASGGAWTLIHLHDFIGADGAVPSAGLIEDASGNLYGTTEAGGTSTQCTNGCGVVFEVSNSSGTWIESVLHSFNGRDGSNLQAQLFMDAAGNLYGTTTAGGTFNFGVVFKMSLVSGTWQTRDLYSFKSGDGDGAFPNSVLIMDAAGNLYGTTGSGGGGDCSVGSDIGCGVTFELSGQGGKWRESILHDFTGAGDGAFPEGLIFGTGGNLYGVAPAGGGGLSGGGLVYELTAPPSPARQ